MVADKAGIRIVTPTPLCWPCWPAGWWRLGWWHLGWGVWSAALAITDQSQHDLLRAHGGEELPHRQREAIFDERIEDAVGVAPLGDQPGTFEHRQVTRDGRPGNRELAAIPPVASSQCLRSWRICRRVGSARAFKMSVVPLASVVSRIFAPLHRCTVAPLHRCQIAELLQTCT